MRYLPRRIWRLLLLSLHILWGIWLILRHGRCDEHGNPSPGYSDIIRRWNARALRILHVEVHVQGTPVEETALWVANHVSWLDIPLIAHLAPVSFLSKAEVARWPIVGFLARRSGTLFIERGARDAANRALEQITWHLVRGRSVLVFPEATTSDGRQVRRFHPRLFAAARLAHCPIQPLALRYPGPDGQPDRRIAFIDDDTALGSLWRILALQRIEAHIAFCPAIHDTDRERRELAEEAWNCVRGLVEQPLAGKAPRTDEGQPQEKS
ncbi:MAG: 1-acyl-sn-glycerol-3-phosphate acyltransferase [Gammaproteobacteria bacterium]|nr:MAG: 1-acyl-sn-glycerol-3-phosphate acyltransferase [Gammaproteobacteria bacterium]